MQTRKRGGTGIPKAGEAASLTEIGKIALRISGKMDEAVRLLGSLNRKASLVTDAYMHGEDRVYPWHRLNTARQRQVLAVREYMAEHPDRTPWFAARSAYRRVANGYPTWQALAAYCYHIKIEHYVGGMPR
jgi:hypothetical protein